MKCDSCQCDADQIVRCDCFESLCRDCFGDHHCGREHLVQFTRAADPPPKPKKRAPLVELAAAKFRLRPYQQQAFDAVIEVLR
jgi:hypothetical protein